MKVLKNGIIKKSFMILYFTYYILT